MKKKSKNKLIAPDGAFTAGPMRVARYGSTTIFQSNWPKDEYIKMQQRCIERLPIVINEIDDLIEEIAALVKVLPPEKLLHRAWWQMATQMMKIESETEIGSDECLAMRMIDYIQSVITSTQPGLNGKKELSDEDWATLNGKVETLFRKLNIEYQICLTHKNKAEPHYNEDLEEFRIRAEAYWCNVRGARYPVHEMAYMKDLFIPHSVVFEELFGITAEEFVSQIIKICHALTFGLNDAFEDLNKFKTASLDAIETKITLDPSLANLDPPDLMARVVKENGWEELQASVLGRMFHLDLFDVQKVSSLPKMLLNELSWSPGEEKGFFAEGPFKGWPLRIWPIFKRPFICLNGRYYCFDVYSLLDHIYRGMQRIIFRLKPAYRDTWNELQQQISEELPFKYFQKLLPSATTFQNVHYKWHPSEGKPKDWCEADGLLICDDHLYIIEARGGAFTYTPPATDMPAYIDSLKNLVLKPATQGKRFLEYLTSEHTVPIFDSARKKVGELRKDDFRKIIVCPVTLDAFTELAAQTQHLRKIGIDVGTYPTWVVSVDDLRVYADIFCNPLVFQHFVEQRMRAFSSEIIQSDDEMDYVGMYLKHNNYTMHANDIWANGMEKVWFYGYRSEVDKFFFARLRDPDTPCPLVQETPFRLTEIVEFLSKTSQKGRVQLSSYLLDLDDKWQRSLSDSIEKELNDQPNNKRPKPTSTHGDINITVFCWVSSHVPPNHEFALDHARAVMLINADANRFLLELTYNDSSHLVAVSWQNVDLTDLSQTKLEQLKEEAKRLRELRVKSAESVKIGRNQACPCGSGKKYKRCCIR